MDFNSWLYFVIAIAILTFTPGPNLFLTISTSVTNGFKLAIYSALGGFLATSIIFTLSYFGLGAIVISSVALFLTIKYLGALYLIYLGIKAWNSKDDSFILTTEDKIYSSAKSSFSKGFLVGASNPKAIIFFTAFLPQFINSKSSLILQFIVLYVTFAIFELFWLIFYAYLARKSISFLQKEGRAKVFNKLTGGIFISIGSYLIVKE